MHLEATDLFCRGQEPLRCVFANAVANIPTSTKTHASMAFKEKQVPKPGNCGSSPFVKCEGPAQGSGELRRCELRH